MFSVDVKLNLKPEDTFARHASNLKDAQRYLDGAIIKDTDEFVPFDQGVLASSAIRASSIGQGEIRYDQVYARRMYYGVNFNFSQDKHPKATHHWFEKSLKLNLDKWGRGVAIILGGLWRRGE